MFTNIIRWSVMQSVLCCGATAIAQAATTGTAMPWDQPVMGIAQNITGPLAFGLTMIAVAMAGAAWAMSHHGQGLTRLISAIVGGSVMIGTGAIMAASGWSGALC